MSSLKQYLSYIQERTERCIASRLPSAAQDPSALHQAMRHSSLGGGKRMRPMLVYCTGKALGLDERQLDAPACAVEFIHIYSLIHDDLPAMDNDELRRGKPTCHVAYGDAVAILAGDALQALAFEILSCDPTIDITPDQRLQMLGEMTVACSSKGMVGGQAIDLAAVGKRLTIEQLENMHMHKTGALIRASVRMAAIIHPNLPPHTAKNLDQYAKCIGLSFQVKDDILDEESDTRTLGKTQGKDQDNNKPTYTALLGLDGAKQKARQLHEQALASLASFGNEANLLRDLSLYIISRKY